jgi:hypothetical protein
LEDGGDLAEVVGAEEAGGDNGEGFCRGGVEVFEAVDDSARDEDGIAKMGHPVVVVRSDVATQPVDARYQLFLSGEGTVSCGFRYLKNHPAEAVERKPKPTRRITVIKTPTANVIMLPPWS